MLKIKSLLIWEGKENLMFMPIKIKNRSLRKNYEEVLLCAEFSTKRNYLYDLIINANKDRINYYAAAENYLSAKKKFEDKKVLFETTYNKDFYNI